MRVYILLSLLAGLAAATEACEDIWTSTKCAKKESKGKCSKSNVIANCQATCGYCEGTTTAAPTTTTTTVAPTTTTTTVASVEGLHGAHVASLTSTSSIVSNDNCGDAAEGYYEEYITGDARYVIVSGAPDHPAEYDEPNGGTPNERCERWQYAALPLEWSASGNDFMVMGVTGFAKSGGTIYDHRSNPDGSLAVYYEWDSLDPYHGHSSPNGQYHYHATPEGWSSAADPSACEHIGYMLDGAKLYGYCEVDGVQVASCYVQNSASTPTNEADYTYTAGDGCHLDECSMMEINGEMAYVLTPEFPQTPMCLKGIVATYYGFTP